jgi:DNA polymerase elongation subunit (family B)
MVRRGDTPKYIADVQMQAIRIMAGESDFGRLRHLLPHLVDFFKSHYRKLVRRQVPIEQLVISQTLSRDIENFKVISPAGAAAIQLSKQGKSVRAGQNVDFVRVKGKPNSISWHLIGEHQQVDLDITWYCEQLLRAADEVFSPFGIRKEVLESWLTNRGTYWLPKDFLNCVPIRWPLDQMLSQPKILKLKPSLT